MYSSSSRPGATCEWWRAVDSLGDSWQLTVKKILFSSVPAPYSVSHLTVGIRTCPFIMSPTWQLGYEPVPSFCFPPDSWDPNLSFHYVLHLTVGIRTCPFILSPIWQLGSEPVPYTVFLHHDSWDPNLSLHFVSHLTVGIEPEEPVEDGALVHCVSQTELN